MGQRRRHAHCQTGCHAPASVRTGSQAGSVSGVSSLGGGFKINALGGHGSFVAQDYFECKDTARPRQLPLFKTSEQQFGGLVMMFHHYTVQLAPCAPAGLSVRAAGCCAAGLRFVYC